MHRLGEMADGQLLVVMSAQEFRSRGGQLVARHRAHRATSCRKCGAERTETNWPKFGAYCIVCQRENAKAYYHATRAYCLVCQRENAKAYYHATRANVPRVPAGEREGVLPRDAGERAAGDHGVGDARGAAGRRRGDMEGPYSGGKREGG